MQKPPGSPSPQRSASSAPAKQSSNLPRPAVVAAVEEPPPPRPSRGLKPASADPGPLHHDKRGKKEEREEREKDPGPPHHEKPPPRPPPLTRQMRALGAWATTDSGSRDSSFKSQHSIKSTGSVSSSGRGEEDDSFGDLAASSRATPPPPSSNFNRQRSKSLAPQVRDTWAVWDCHL